LLETAIKAEVFATSKLKKKVVEITPKPRTALFQKGANDVTVAANILAPNNSCMDSTVSNSEIPVDGDDTMVMVNYYDSYSMRIRQAAAV
jgi:hypothetical protein